MKIDRTALKRAVAGKAQRAPRVQMRQAETPDYGYSADPEQLSQSFEVTKKVDIGALTFKKDDIAYVRYTGSGGIYDIINDANEQERIGPDEMTALIQDGTLVPYLM
ncbi:MAG: hypothetical protein GWN58_33255 [Anaerolineae bacterium]|nr:hypothetical protein [Thermoplasmata archaeon]NIV34144.1 hypothetical protein [Anaerolineae bacterium]NIY05995.1 hypothetical protein [Thermoplasmata archaeon]